MFLPSDAEKFEEQATIYREMLDACLAIPRCRTFVTWGFTDQHSWIPSEVPGFGDALPLDASYHPKAAVAALRSRLTDGRG